MDKTITDNMKWFIDRWDEILTPLEVIKYKAEEEDGWRYAVGNGYTISQSGIIELWCEDKIVAHIDVKNVLKLYKVE